jgi:hypothetical protein
MKVIVKIHAGMGNQMFQYAMGRSLSLQKQAQLFLDNWGYQTDTRRPYELGRFDLSAGIVSKGRHKCELQFRGSLKPLRWLLNAIRFPIISKYVEDAEQGFDQKLLLLDQNVYLDGYWQSELYFKGIRDLLLKEFTFKDAPNAENAGCLSSIASQNAVCVHIRRGDYCTNNHYQMKYGVCPLDYYRTAIGYIEQRIIDPAFFIFSDDPPWVHSDFPRRNSMTIVSHNFGRNDSEDLRLMMNCRHFIIANSSFSWWGAWLAQFPQKIVIAPKLWYITPDKSDKDLVPESWVRL